jgi:hypothetical protein
MTDIWNVISSAGTGGLIMMIVQQVIVQDGRMDERVFEARREAYAQLLGTLRIYAWSETSKRQERRDDLWHALSVAMLYARPDLREYLVVCGRSLDEIKDDSIPLIFCSRGLSRLEDLMKDELRIKTPSLFWLLHQHVKRCPCGSGKRFKECHGAEK